MEWGPWVGPGLFWRGDRVVGDPGIWGDVGGAVLEGENGRWGEVGGGKILAPKSGDGGRLAGGGKFAATGHSPAVGNWRGQIVEE